MDNSLIQPTTKRLVDYKPFGFEIHSVELCFELHPERTKVSSILHVVKVQETETHLYLDGQDLELETLKIDSEVSVDYQLDDESLSIAFPFDKACIEVVTWCNPKKNKTLEGLYFAANAFCTQCEAEGFRKITYYPDRPDVLSTFTVKVIAEREHYPYLLANGNKVDSGEDGNSHWVTWHDPYKKPCYLFALVAGNFDLVTDKFITKSGNEVSLELFVDRGNGHRGSHALESLKKAMLWDEQTFGLEYDLDIYMIVAVDFFNMGAMENKGLNVFNSKFVLADKDSATDEDYFNIESIIAHEYFHNWTGNRVTCRDWFQLSLKEGLTVFRDQQFSSDMFSPTINRLKQVQMIREHQFAEDAGPMAHPIRPTEVIEMNNFYTVTVYDKGAEVIRMMHTLLGKDGFRKGMDLYFKRHDGQAVTCNDFVRAMEDASEIDLSQFRGWYSQSGTPVVDVNKHYCETDKILTLKFSQSHPVTADQKEKQDLHIPIAWELFGETSNKPRTGVFSLKKSTDALVLNDVDDQQKVALFTDFSAPVKPQLKISFDESVAIMLNAQDGFCRWDAAQRIYSDLIWSISDICPNAGGKAKECVNTIVSGLMKAEYKDPGLLAELLTLPGINSLSEQREVININALYLSRKALKVMLADSLQEILRDRYQALLLDEYHYSTEDVAKRRIKNLFLEYWTLASANSELAVKQLNDANNMTDALGALTALQTAATLDVFDQKMCQFEQRWQNDVLVLDKWFAMNAGTDREDILARLDLLTAHQNFKFDNPNRVRSVVGTFAFYNTAHFHKADGSGYAYVANKIIKLNGVNPQVASRIITPFLKWSKYEGSHSEMMRAQLLRIADTPDLSKDLFEKVSKSLSD